MGGEEILTATESSTDPTEAGANLAHQSPSTYNQKDITAFSEG